jgi:AcrR family transcriptional regulator
MPQKPLATVPPRLGRARRLDRGTLITAAAELVDRDDPDKLTLAALADALGVKAPSLYAHIASLQQLKTGIAVLGLRELEIELARASAGKSGKDALKSLCWGYRAYAKRRPGVYLATVLWTASDDEDVRAAGNALKDTVLKAFPLSSKRNKGAEQIHLLRLMRISMHGFIALEMARAFGEPVDPEETFKRLVEQLAALIDE